MKAHELIESFISGNMAIIEDYKNDPESREIIATHVSRAIISLKNAHHFYLDIDVIENDFGQLLSTATNFIENDVFVLPYPVVSFNINLRDTIEGFSSCYAMILAITQHDMVYFYEFIKYDEWKIGPIASQVKFSSGMNVAIADKLIKPERLSEYKLHAHNSIRNALAIIIALQAKGTVIEDVIPDVRLNKARIKRDRLPLFEYKRLFIDGSVKKSPNNLGGTHASPRIHFRRGHVRTLPTGRKVPVQACVVGKKENGVIIKDYEVRGGGSKKPLA